MQSSSSSFAFHSLSIEIDQLLFIAKFNAPLRKWLIKLMNSSGKKICLKFGRGF